LRLEQVFPQLAGKNQVRWYRFDWRETEFNPAATGAAVHLYFYDENVARHAKAAISAAYRDLAQTFDYYPGAAIPFLLYNAHFEFESTQAFLVSEGVLGVTSPEDLRMAVPYWGEHRRFDEVMRHELVHQFSIQKMLQEGRAEGCNPLDELPLWFVEGIAQYYSHAGLTTEARAELIARVRAPRKSERLPRFFADEPATFERVYLIGHAQAAFLDDAFGRGTVRAIIDRVGSFCKHRSFFGSRDEAGQPLARLAAEVTGVRSQEIERRWRAWAGRVAAPAARAGTPAAAERTLGRHGRGEIDSFSLSPDGRTLFYRSVDFETGEARLFLQSTRDPGTRIEVARDQHLGLESLHPVDRRVTALGRGVLAYVGRTGRSDVLFVARYQNETHGGKDRLRVGAPVRHPLTMYRGLIEAGYPAVDPVGGHVAFIGLDGRTGYLDVYALTRPLDERSPLMRLTNDPYAEQGLTYAPDGSLYTASDATGDGRYALVRLNGGVKVPLARPAGAGDAVAPAAASDGTLVFQSGVTGLEQAYRVVPRTAARAGAGAGGGLTRLTDAPTGLLDPVPDPAGGLYAVARMRDKRTLVHLDGDRLLAWPVTAAAGGEARPLPAAPITGARAYAPLARKNFGLIAAQAAAASGPFGVGRLVFADTFRTHIVGLTAFYAGDIDVGEFEAAYMDRSRRVGLGGSAFLENGLQLETPVSTRTNAYLLRRFGAAFQAELPLSPFVRLTGALAPEQLRTYRFSSPGSEFARRHRLATFATEARAGFAFDSLGYTLWGPSRGQSFTFNARGTLAYGQADPFGDLAADYQIFYSPVRRVAGLTATLRAAAGTSLGGAFREQYFLPAAYNYRVVREGTLALYGEHYAVAQAALLFPLTPVLARAIFVQGTVGADGGAIEFDVNRLWAGRRAAAVGGVNMGLGPLVVRLHVSRPFAVGGGERAKNVWNSYFSILLSPLLFQYSLQ
jgi:hypothetical protein